MFYMYESLKDRTIVEELEAPVLKKEGALLVCADTRLHALAAVMEYEHGDNPKKTLSNIDYNGIHYDKIEDVVVYYQ